jgi:hypothetical protein
MPCVNEHQTPLPNIYYSLVVDGEVASNWKVCVSYEEWVTAFASDPTIELENDADEISNAYTLTVKNKIVSRIKIPKSDEMVNAIFQSNPTVIKLTDEQLEIGIGPGWFWNGTEFIEGEEFNERLAKI